MNSGQLVLRQARLEQRAFWRNPEYATFTFALPLVLLVALGATRSGRVVPGTGVKDINILVPGILAFGVVVAAYANLAIRIAVLRNEGVLKRVRTTPLAPQVYLGGQLASTLASTLLVAALTVVVGWIAFGVGPRAGGIPVLIAALCFGIVCFAALALALSAIVSSADAAGPITNASYLPLAILSGVFDPMLDLPKALSTVIDLFPIKALSVALRAAYLSGDVGVPWRELGVLAGWAVIGMLLANRFFRWQPS